MFFILITREPSLNKKDLLAPTLEGHSQLYQGSGPLSCTTTPRQPFIYEQFAKVSVNYTLFKLSYL